MIIIINIYYIKNIFFSYNYIILFIHRSMHISLYNLPGFALGLYNVFADDSIVIAERSRSAINTAMRVPVALVATILIAREDR